MLLRLCVSVLLFCILAAAPAAAQPEVVVGAAASFKKAQNDAIGETGLTPIPFVRLVPKAGFSAAWGLSWFENEFDLSGLGGPPVQGKLNIRPVMIGFSYTFGDRDLALSMSLVSGYAFNSLRGASGVKISHAPVTRPGVNLWKSVAPRVGLSVFGGYVITRPTLTIDGFARRIRADYAVVSVGAGVILF